MKRGSQLVRKMHVVSSQFLTKTHFGSTLKIPLYVDNFRRANQFMLTISIQTTYYHQSHGISSADFIYVGCHERPAATQLIVFPRKWTAWQ